MGNMNMKKAVTWLAGKYGMKKSEVTLSMVIVHYAVMEMIIRGYPQISYDTPEQTNGTQYDHLREAIKDVEYAVRYKN